MVLLKFISLTCNETEGIVTTDQIYLKVNGVIVWGNYPMEKKSVKDLTLEKEIDFVNPLKLQLYDDDFIDDDDLLGTKYIISNNFDGKHHTVIFDSDDANYALEYEILDTSYLTFVKLKCNKKEDWFGNDSIYLNIDGVKQWGNYPMGKGDERDLSSEKPVFFKSPINLELYEEDTANSDDFLGTNKVMPIQEQKKLSYTNDDADYDLYINVVSPLAHIIPEIRKIVGTPAYGNEKATREKLKINEEFTIQIDVAGEGYMEVGKAVVGFKTAINLNDRLKASQQPNPEIPHLILIKDWENEYPFGDNFADYITMQNAPLTIHNVKEIARVIKKNGTIGLWIDPIFKNEIQTLADLLKSKVEVDCFDEFDEKANFKKIQIIANK